MIIIEILFQQYDLITFELIFCCIYAILQVLGYCISQLSTQKKTDKGVHIPYRSLGLMEIRSGDD